MKVVLCGEGCITNVSLIVQPFSDMKRFNSIDYGQFRMDLLRNERM